MASTVQVVRRGGVSLPTLLFVIFLVLRLTDNIDWAWIWVFSPLWISFGVFAFLFVFLFVFGLYIVG